LAEKYFQKAVNLEPEYAGALLGLAYVHTSKGNTQLALNNVELAIKNGFGYEQLAEDPSLLALHSLPEWKALMKNYFPDQFKD
jgi:hypothetical protein